MSHLGFQYLQSSSSSSSFSLSTFPRYCCLDDFPIAESQSNLVLVHFFLFFLFTPSGHSLWRKRAQPDIDHITMCTPNCLCSCFTPKKYILLLLCASSRNPPRRKKKRKRTLLAPGDSETRLKGRSKGGRGEARAMELSGSTTDAALHSLLSSREEGRRVET